MRTHNVLLLLFVASGCAALIYEIVWFHLLRLVIGASALSLGILLAAFMGGMFLGSLLLARIVPSTRHPLQVYAWIEIGIGAFGIVLPLVLPAVRALYVGLLRPRHGRDRPSRRRGGDHSLAADGADGRHASRRGAKVRPPSRRNLRAGRALWRQHSRRRARLPCGLGFTSCRTGTSSWPRGIAAALNLAIGVTALRLSRRADDDDDEPCRPKPSARRGRRRHAHHLPGGRAFGADGSRRPSRVDAAARPPLRRNHLHLRHHSRHFPRRPRRGQRSRRAGRSDADSDSRRLLAASQLGSDTGHRVRGVHDRQDHPLHGDPARRAHRHAAQLFT